MPPGGRERPSPIDRFTDASATAITSGFTAAMALGPQPKAGPPKPERHDGALDGADWLRSLQQVSGLSGNNSFGGGSGARGQLGTANGGSGMGEEDDFSEDEDGESEGDSPAVGSKKKGRKGRPKAKGAKTANDESSAAQRKAQNRIAQREFRQRKQQYIRALESRVELLSSDHDTQVDRLRYALRGLLAENNQLRSILGSVSSFIGSEMIGGPLQKAGTSRAELEHMITNSSEKTMTETWQNWPGARECEALRQIRLESNLPPEGLPESHKLPEHAIANTVAAHAAAAARDHSHGSPLTSSTSGDAEKVAKAKRKGTGDGEEPNKVKRKQPKSQDDHERPGEHQQLSSGPNLAQPPAPTSSEGPMAHFYGTDQGAQLASFLSQSTMPPGFASPSGFPTFAASPTSFSPSQTQDSSAILASLFGVSGMGGYMGQTSHALGPAHYHGLNMSADSPIAMNSIRQKTIANVEEPEEIKRLSTFAARLRSDANPFGPPKEESQLSSVVNAVSELIHEMSNFRRQPSYQLPTLLQPSDIQQTRPHDPLIDALPFSGLRQQLIMHQDQLIMEDVFLALLYHTTLHSGTAMVESNWELNQGFFLAYPHLFDQQTAMNGNRWRATRNESPLDLDKLSSPSQ